MIGIQGKKGSSIRKSGRLIHCLLDRFPVLVETLSLYEPDNCEIVTFKII